MKFKVYFFSFLIVCFSFTRTTHAENNALDFNSSNVNFGNSSLLQFDGAGAFSFEAWVYPNSVSGGWYSILSKSIYNNNQGFILVILNGNLGLVVGTQDTYSSTSISAGAWTHVALTYDNGTWKVYQNGSEVISLSRTYANANVNFVIGQRQYNDGSFLMDNYNGMIDELRIWNSALSQATIQQNYDKKFSGSESGLIGYYDFDEGTAGGNNTSLSTLTDRTNNALTGTLNAFSLSGSSDNFISSTVSFAPYSLPQTFAIVEGSSNGTSIGTIAATDGNNGQTLSFSIASGNEDGKFALNTNGQITVAGTLDDAVTAQYILSVTISDDGNPIKTSTVAITINIIDILAGINAPKENLFQLFPNPSSGKITIETESHARVYLLDAYGKMIQTLPLENNLSSLEGLSAGIYFVEVQINNLKSIKKLVIE